MLPLNRPLHLATYPLKWLAMVLAPLATVWLVAALFTGAAAAHGMTDDLLRSLRKETVDLFYHGFDSYMNHAFPDDELKPVSCQPLTRDRANPAHIEVNDVLGNYSLTLIDSLSTLAILASSPDLVHTSRDPLLDFQNGVTSLIGLYGDGSQGPRGVGTRSKGFDLDSKVQVFETVIRGVGGLLSAHLFAVGDLPINRTAAHPKKGGIFRVKATNTAKPPAQVGWPNDFQYDGQLLRLAEDLAKRLVPAFYTETGLPYPRVNLRYGVPFYANSPLNVDSEHGICGKEAANSAEITETCSAGAGSLVLEFATLSRLTGEPLYERLAKSAFWAVWDRRSNIDLIGAGIDAENGGWIDSYTGIGAGIDSFFEYALKSHILLSGTTSGPNDSTPDDFLAVWQDAHASIRRHIFRGSRNQHPHYIQADLFTGAPRAFWIDSLSAYYPGLLTLAGQVDEAIETHMLFAALWTRYGALPERWSTSSGTVEAGLRWWGGRPEFIESTWYLYQATKDPWYLFVAEMTLRDIQRRCWTDCGWAGLEDVRTGELKDRMESFFLGETAKYLYLLFDPTHPLNKLDGALVFTTEGHPLLLSEASRGGRGPRRKPAGNVVSPDIKIGGTTCPAPPAPLPFSISNTASRQDLFHAASLARLHQLPKPEEPDFSPAESAYTQESFAQARLDSRNNFTFYPWTLPTHLIPTNGISSKIVDRMSFELTFPTLEGSPIGTLSLKRVDNGVIVNSVSGLAIELTRDMASIPGAEGQVEIYRVSQVGSVALGRDEKVFMAWDTLSKLSPSDPIFMRHRDLAALDLILEVDEGDLAKEERLDDILESTPEIPIDLNNLADIHSKEHGGLLKLLLEQFVSGQNAFASLLQGNNGNSEKDNGPRKPALIPGLLSTGIGAGPLPSTPDAPLASFSGTSTLPWKKIYFGDEACADKLPADVPRTYEVIVLRRGGCSFAEKLQNIPAFPPVRTALQLVVVVSYPQFEDPEGSQLVQPLVDKEQVTPSGMRRINQIPLVMVSGGDATMELLQRTKAIGIKRRYRYESQGYRIENLEVV